MLKAVATSLMKVADLMKVSSLHITFNTAEEAEALKELGFINRTGIQFHWENK